MHRKSIYQMGFVAMLIACWVIPTMAASLVWDANTDTVDGYKVYYGTSAASPSDTVDVANVTQYSLDRLPLAEGVEYHFSVTAYNAAGESDRSATVGFTPADQTPPLPPGKIVLEIQ
jgi:hypothetical protein